jgi:hypothetical protein
MLGKMRNFTRRGMRLNKWKYSVVRKKKITLIFIQGFPGGKVNILRGHNIGRSKQKLYMYMCPVPNGFRYRAISLYTSKIVVSDTGIHCSSDKIGTVYLV